MYVEFLITYFESTYMNDFKAFVINKNCNKNLK